MEKYCLTDNTIYIAGNRLYQIKALKDFGKVKKGDLGGYIASEDNLSQTGNCWVFQNAMVFDNAKVLENAEICGNISMYDNSMVSGNSICDGNIYLCDNCRITGYAVVNGNSILIKNNAIIGGYSQILSTDKSSIVGGDVIIGENITIVNCGIRREKDYIYIPFEYPLKGGVAVYTGHDNRILISSSKKPCLFRWGGCHHGILSAVKKGDYKEMTLKEYIDYLEAETYSLFLIERKRYYLYNLLEGLKVFRNNM